MKDSHTYNGYTNRETWALGLWFTNDYDMYQSALAWAMHARGDVTLFERMVRGAWHEMDTVMRLDVGADLSSVNWEELVNRLTEGVE